MEDRKIEDARDAVKPQDRNQRTEVVEFSDPVKFLSTVSFSELPERPVLNAQAGATTLSLLNVERVKLQNTSPVTITSLTGGQEGQQVTFLGDGNTTLANNTVIKTSTGANKLLATDAVYSFTYISSKWVEAAAPASLTAGAGISIAGNTISNIYVGKHVCVLGDTTGSVSLTATVPRGVGGFVNVNLTGMNNVKLSYMISALGAGDVYPILYWSSNGSVPSTAFSFAGTGAQQTGAVGGTTLKSATVALPVGMANQSNVWIQTTIYPTATTTGTFVGLHLEFTP